MGRMHVIELHCDECGGTIEYSEPGDDHTQLIRAMNGIVSKYGDFCCWECYRDYLLTIKKGAESGSSEN